MSLSYVTQDGMTKSQPGINVSVMSPAPCGTGVELHVSRTYRHLTNQWGGKGVSKPLDGNNMVFPTQEQAWEYARSHGYLRPFFFPELRARRKARAAS